MRSRNEERPLCPQASSKQPNTSYTRVCGIHQTPFPDSIWKPKGISSDDVPSCAIDDCDVERWGGDSSGQLRGMQRMWVSDFLGRKADIAVELKVEPEFKKK